MVIRHYLFGYLFVKNYYTKQRYKVYPHYLAPTLNIYSDYHIGYNMIYYYKGLYTVCSERFVFINIRIFGEDFSRCKQKWKHCEILHMFSIAGTAQIWSKRVVYLLFIVWAAFISAWGAAVLQVPGTGGGGIYGTSVKGVSRFEAAFYCGIVRGGAVLQVREGGWYLRHSRKTGLCS